MGGGLCVYVHRCIFVGFVCKSIYVSVWGLCVCVCRGVIVGLYVYVYVGISLCWVLCV